MNGDREPGRAAGRTAGRTAGPGIAVRLLLAQMAVVVAGGAAALIVAAVVGPPLFHRHLMEAGTMADSAQMMHVEQAYGSANTLTLGGAALVALVTASAITWYLSRRLTRPLVQLSAVGLRLSDGDYSARATPASAGPELARLTDTFNQVAGRLEHTEATRRRLLSDLAHELRTPIATIEAYLDGLDDGVTTWGEEAARVLRDQTARLHRLADDLGDVSRAEEARLEVVLEPLPVHTVVESAIGALRPDYAAKGVDLRAAYDGKDDRAPLDPQRLAQALTNVLANALRHTPAGGSVEVAVDAGTDGEVRVTVTDTGDGIAPDQLDQIFERFYRGDSARSRDRGGSGIGLTISRAIVHAHRGTLVAHSDGPGTGARFVLTLPR
ncbi:sensor histidine kinase [Calidifontibacter terrae]